ncbi:MAG: bifunctional diaminohydroxyphosphoribosylaminopyrimidine deaminase/5-amino-6-(5-phosphoribosylamino)uracil reductase RibD, partial [Roseivivax sp.]|nr:bifunctional diaminohydroxyphosphoribosylaminopyrimidine deaminase/5-amino-6-(5-phosphoribosylamino)uracil reductase RibD [Roseivivax sp.]
CAEALVAAGIARVVSAQTDPDPRVAGRGHAILRAAGIEVTEGIREAEARELQRGFLTRVMQGRPMLTLKLASSFDGRIATASGESQWITGPDARRHVHALRLSHDAVMVGGGTARADDPSLTVRGMGTVRQPLRVVLSRHLDLPLTGTLAQTAEQVPVWLCHGASASAELCDAWDGIGARRLPVAVRGGQLDARAALQALGAAGLTRVFCEGGGALAASLLNAGLVDELVVFAAGLALGAEGRPALGAMGIGALAEAPRYALAEAVPVGGDVMMRWRRTDAAG